MEQQLLIRDKEQSAPKSATDVTASPNGKRKHHSHGQHVHNASGECKCGLPGLFSTLQHAHTYHAASDSSDQLMSMRFMHKPKRSSKLLEKTVDPTRENSIWNSKTHQASDQDESSEGASTSQSPEPHEPEAISAESKSLDTSSPKQSPEELGSAQTIGYKLVRKKSGELVKPSLKEPGYFDSNIKRSRSLPTTPTYKLVHFGGDNDVKYFKKRDIPSAISASNSPSFLGLDGQIEGLHLNGDDDSYEDETDEEELQLGSTPPFNLNSAAITRYPNPHHQPRIDWELQLLNFGDISYDRKIHQQEAPVFLERVYISVDKKYLVGHIAVKNLSYEKHVTIRYTLDDWCTIIEIPTTYSTERPNVLKQNEYDRFTFKVSLESLFNSFRIRNDQNKLLEEQENKYSLCIKYTTQDLEYWDNNASLNYNLKLIKRLKTHTSSKIEEHKLRPRYSSSYLKRRLSDSKIEVATPHLEGKPITNQSPDTNDFVKNDFYMSSPMFSSLSSTSDGKFKHSADSLFSPRSITNNSIGPLPQLAPTFPKSDPNADESSIGTISHEDNLLFDGKSYQDLLDKFCFFNSRDPAGDGDSTLNNDKGNGSPTFTVSSLLGT